MNKMNKKGFEYIDDILTFIFVSVVLMIAIGFVLWMFYSAGGDVRMEEGRVLAVKLTDAVVENGYLNELILDEDFNSDDLMELALIDENVVNSGGNFYFKVSVKDEVEKEFTGGKTSLEASCELSGRSEKLPECYRKKLIVYDKEGRKFVINILTASRQSGGGL